MLREHVIIALSELDIYEDWVSKLIPSWYSAFTSAFANAQDLPYILILGLSESSYYISVFIFLLY